MAQLVAKLAREHCSGVLEPLGQPETSIVQTAPVRWPGRLQRVVSRPERHSGRPVTHLARI